MIAGSEVAEMSEVRPLADKIILLIEDEALIAMDLIYELEQAGAAVVGPVTTVARAVQAANDTAVDAAIVDVDLSGEDVYPAADLLHRGSVPMVFHTGHASHQEISARYPAAALCTKPIAAPRLIGILAELL